MKPKVSIIIPAYNSSRYIKRAIESVLCQTEKNIEVIVVDDASTDNTVEVVRQFCDHRLKLMVNECNQGPSYSRNRALKEAQGEWVALLDSDDWYVPERLEKLLQVAYTENADIVADNIYYILDGAELPWSTFFSLEKISLDKPRQIDTVYFIDFSVSVTKPIIKRNFLLQHQLEFNEALKYEEDFFLFLLCLCHGANFILVPETYYFYRNRSDSLMTEGFTFYEQAYNTNLYFLQQDFIKKNPKVLRSLSRRFLKIKQRKAFHRIRHFVKQKAFLSALIEAVRNPMFLPILWKKLPGIIKYRLSSPLALITQTFANSK
ncbi:MAG: glycosyltransferase family 2 protein [Scytonema sp. PMC 1070.18]|nr:glycosyltransferase family 2 protein [Scytonema sp. PMC 1070.18]